MNPLHMTDARLLLIGTVRPELRLAAEMARAAGAAVTIASAYGEALSLLRGAGCELIMLEVSADAPGFVSQLRRERIAVPVIACGIDASASLAVSVVRAGARDYVPLPPDQALIAAAIASIAARPGHLRSADPVTGAIEARVPLLAHEHGILLSGEPGTGREALARLIHASTGAQAPFQIVDCQAPADWVASALFGHEEGEFAGAVARRSGRLAEAAGGTLFLREIGALPSALQHRLASEMSLSPARVVACTSADLSAQDCHFAPGLLQLFSCKIDLPALRDRRIDVEPLARHFAAYHAALEGLPERPFSERALARLMQHQWPGNVAELQEVVHKAVLLAHGSFIDLDAIELPAPSRAEVAALVGHTVADVERELILHTLERCRGNRTSASTILGISVRTMRNKLRSFIEAGIPVAPAPSGIADF